MKRKTTVFAIVALLMLFMCGASGCAGIGTEDSGYDIYFARLDGKDDPNNWLILREATWKNAYGDVGTFTAENMLVTFYDNGGKVYATGTISEDVVSVSKDGSLCFYYGKNYSENSANTEGLVYAVFVNLGFEGTLDDLFEAFNGQNAYELAKKNGYEGTESEWLDSLKGVSGEAGTTPVIEDGYWYIGEVNTGVRAEGTPGAGITSIEQVDMIGNQAVYRITYADGKTFDYTVTNGKDGVDGKDGMDGKDGADGYTLTPEDLYDFMLENGYDGSYVDFVKLFAPKEKDLSAETKGMLASVSIYTLGGTASGIIYDINKETGDALIITNYHCVFNSYAAEGEADYFADANIYLYGSEVRGMEIPAEFIGGSKVYDVAVLKVTNNDLIKSSIAQKAEFVDSDKVYVGESIMAIGNAVASGIGVTEGTVNMVSEDVVAELLGTDSTVSRRVIRVSASVNPGNSGGGVFDEEGKAIGMVVSKYVDIKVDNIGHVIPANVVLAVAENIIDAYRDDPTQPHKMNKPLVGMTIYVKESFAVIDEITGAASVEETICVQSTVEGGLCHGLFEEDDVILYITVGEGESKRVTHMYIVTDSVMRGKVGDIVTFRILRNNVEQDISLTITEAAINIVE